MRQNADIRLAEAAPQPIVTVGDSTLNGTFTIAMFDINTVGEDLPNGPTRHWLLNGVTLEGNTVSNATATAITAYAGPGPAAGSGAHRYVLLYTIWLNIPDGGLQIHRCSLPATRRVCRS